MTDFGLPAPDAPGEQRRWLIDAIRTVQLPGTLLLWFGAASLVLAVLALIVYLVSPATLFRPAYDRLVQQQKDRPPAERQPLPAYEEWSRPIQIAYVIATILALGSSFVIAYGGMKMRLLAGYRWAMAAAVLSIVPITNCCCCAGLPIGIWALVVLFGSDVRLAFGRVAAAGGIDVLLTEPPSDGLV